MDTSEIRLEAQDLNQQGVMLMKTGNLDEAKAKFDKAIELDPMLSDSYKNYGDLYMSVERYEDAKNNYKKALLIEKRGDLYFSYGNACFMMDSVHEGLEYYNLAISAGFDNEDMMFFMGMAYEHLNDTEMALRYFQKACQKNPSRPDFAVKKIAAMVRLNLIDSAEESVDKLLLSSPELFDAYHIKTQLLIHKGDMDEATKFAKAAAERFPEDADLMYDYVKCVTFSYKFDEALTLIDTAKKMKYYEESKSRFVLLEAQISAEIKDFERAFRCCNECIEMENGDFNGDARFLLMNLCLTSSDYEKAYENACKIIANDAEDSFYYAALYYRPYCLGKMEHKEEAMDFYKEAISIYRTATLKDPESVDIYLYRALCLRDIEQYDKALELLDFIHDIAGDLAEIYTIRADIYDLQGRKAKANEEREKAYRIKPELRPKDSEGDE